MSDRNPLIVVPLRYGLIGGLISIIAILFLYYMGRHPLLLNPVLDIRWPLYIIFIFFSMKTYKDQYSNGIMHFWQGMIIGFVNYMTMALVVAVFIQIFAGIETTKFLAQYVQLATEQIQNNRTALLETINEETLVKTLADLPKTTATHLAADYLLKSMPVGLILTILFAMLMRKN